MAEGEQQQRPRRRASTSEETPTEASPTGEVATYDFATMKAYAQDFFGVPYFVMDGVAHHFKLDTSKQYTKAELQKLVDEYNAREVS